MHPYVDSAGTVWVSELQLEDGTSATAFVNENGKTKEAAEEIMLIAAAERLRASRNAELAKNFEE